MNRKISSIVLGGLVAGALDISYAIIFSALRSGVPPIRILQSVASGVLGRDAYSGGFATAALGFGLHFFMALCIAAIYLLAARWIPALIRRPVLYGAVYGILVYAVMNLVVLPLSNFPSGAAPALVTVVTGLLVHMFLVGVPIAFASRRAYVAPAG